MKKDKEMNQESVTAWQKVSRVIDEICNWVYRLRKVVMAVPVVYCALKLAIDNSKRLPEIVGLNLQSTGVFALTVPRAVAVQGPLWVTAAALVLMFISKKAAFPWIVSVLTLLLPYLIYFTNMYVI